MSVLRTGAKAPIRITHPAFGDAAPTQFAGDDDGTEPGVDAYCDGLISTHGSEAPGLDATSDLPSAAPHLL